MSLPRLADSTGMHPLFALSLRLRLAGYGRRYGRLLRTLAGVLDAASRIR